MTMNFARGYKTYTISAIAILIGIDQGLIAAHAQGMIAFQAPAIPSWVLFFLTAAGLYTARSGTSDDVSKLTQNLLSQVMVPAPVIPTAPSIVTASATKTMTAKANGTPYADFIKAGWTDAELIANGYMTKSQ